MVNEVRVINNLNLNAFVYNMKFKLKGYGKMAPHVYREHLNKDFFSTEASRDLLFYDEDLKYLKLVKVRIKAIKKNIKYEINNNISISRPFIGFD
jgi:hypothetical protein